MAWALNTRYKRATERVERYTREYREHVQQCSVCQATRETRVVSHGGFEHPRILGRCREGFRLQRRATSAKKHLEDLPLLPDEMTSE